MARKPKYIWHPDEVRALRKHLGMSQMEFAEELGCYQDAISNWETGQKRPNGISSNALLRIAEQSDFHYEVNESALLL